MASGIQKAAVAAAAFLLCLSACGPIVVVSGQGGGGYRPSPAIRIPAPSLVRLPAEIPLDFHLSFSASLTSAVDGFFHNVQNDLRVADGWTRTFIEPGRDYMRQYLALTELEERIRYTPRSKVHVELRGTNEGDGAFFAETALGRILASQPASGSRYRWQAVTTVEFEFDPAQPNRVKILGKLNVAVARHTHATIYATEGVQSAMVWLDQESTPTSLANLAGKLNDDLLAIYKKYLSDKYRLTVQ